MIGSVWLFMGPPGCGKGTQATKLKVEGRAEHLSTGDLLRSAISSKSQLGLKVQGYVDSGSLVPDNVMLEILMETILKFDGKSPLILDGYPRTLSQGESLFEVMNRYSNKFKLKGAIWFKITPEVLIKRAVGRRVCSSCGAIYNIEFKPPAIEGVCDLCGGKLIHRKDDTADTISKRITLYNHETQPLLEYIRSRTNLIELDADRPENIIFDEIGNYLKKL